VIPGDVSSAAFFMVGASIADGSSITMKNVGVNPTRTGVIDILRLMGASIELEHQRFFGNEPVADVVVNAAPLQGIAIPAELVPLAIDEFPAIAIAAACAQGETVLTGAKELRIKESDRISAIVNGLKAVGINASESPDGFSIRGGEMSGGTVDSHGDHRIAMAFALAGVVAGQSVTIRACDNIATSFPDFHHIASKAGLRVSLVT
jgi:3-phosphoshikimate 1-carboxyvinyltransferase